MNPFPCLVRSVSPSGEPRYALGHPLVDAYLEFVAGRCRPNTVRAVAFDLKTFFAVLEVDPLTVRPTHVFEFLAHQRGDRTVVRMTDRESGLSARTIARRLCGSLIERCSSLRQGRSSTGGADRQRVLHRGRGLPARRTTIRCRHRPGLRRAENGPDAGTR
jgi:hypothetical protein